MKSILQKGFCRSSLISQDFRSESFDFIAICNFLSICVQWLKLSMNYHFSCQFRNHKRENEIRFHNFGPDSSKTLSFMSKVMDQKSNTQKLYHNFFALASKKQHFTTQLPHDQVVLNWAALLQRAWEFLAALYLPSKNKTVKRALIDLYGKLQSSKMT